MNLCERSSAPLASGSRASRISQPTAIWAAEAGKSVGRLAAAGVDRALAVPDQRLGQRTETGQAARHAKRDVLPLLGEDQRAGERARVAELGGHDPAAAALAVADRNLRPRLKEVELQQL